MRTNKNITFSALNSHYLDTSDMCITVEYFNDALIMWGMNTEKFYCEIANKRRAIKSLVWNIFEDLANHHIKDNEYPYNQDMYASSDQLKSWLKTYGNGYDTLQRAIDYFTAERDDLKWSD